MRYISTSKIENFHLKNHIKFQFKNTFMKKVTKLYSTLRYTQLAHKMQNDELLGNFLFIQYVPTMYHEHVKNR